MTLKEARQHAIAVCEATEKALALDRQDEAQRSGTITVRLNFAGRGLPLPIEEDAGIDC